MNQFPIGPIVSRKDHFQFLRKFAICCSGAWEKLIHGKNLKLKISCQASFNTGNPTPELVPIPEVNVGKAVTAAHMDKKD
jgi:hypothetical protein